MILVVTGTIGFSDLVKKVDELLERGKIKDNVILQIGDSDYIPKNCKYFKFKPSLEPYYKMADLVISHGGAATTFEAVCKGIKLISINNPHRIDRHQEDLLTVLSKNKNLLWCRNLAELDKYIAKAEKFKFKKYIKPVCEIHKEIIRFLDKI